MDRTKLDSIWVLILARLFVTAWIHDRIVREKDRARRSYLQTLHANKTLKKNDLDAIKAGAHNLS